MRTVELMNIRDLQTTADYRACEDLQRLTWGRDFGEVVTQTILKIVQKIGGVAAGAFDDDGGMLGFVLGFTGWKGGQPCHWSHMLAVRPQAQDQGIGRRLKEYQRDKLLKAGVGLMYWTYDPLVARNAHFNICRLGVSVTEYVPDMYGTPDDTALDRVIGTDRFIVAWHLEDSLRTLQPPELPTVTPTNATIRPDGDLDLTDFRPDNAAFVGIAIPSDVHELKGIDAALAARWRSVTRDAFQYYFDAGYSVRGFEADPARTFGVYVLGREP